MSEPTRHGTIPIELPHLFDEVEPDPVEGCAGCAALAQVREWARATGDRTTITDANVLMRRHPEGHR
ncbi:hypothetical protein [Streptomyces spirodelae]|uniref:Uncharacterized protein n=1 Tax=Streptomyces spirodelae TaxID=2812904 RepID=A0ABS3X129_9ACTN|nr:hypothetical protein [Streptomyces spirodelae]MBO8188767.1 hypothetical protein [Streptomyces spirodelae]